MIEEAARPELRGALRQAQNCREAHAIEDRKKETKLNECNNVDLIPTYIKGLPQQARISLGTRILQSITEVDKLGSTEKQRENPCCPNCGGEHTVRHGCRGKNMNIRRYLCRDCGKAFQTSSVPVVTCSRRGEKQWASFVDAVLNGKTLKQCAAAAKIAVPTACKWRKRIWKVAATLIAAPIGNAPSICHSEEAKAYTVQNHFTIAETQSANTR